MKKLIIVFGRENKLIGENKLCYEKALSSINNPSEECVCFTDANVGTAMGEMAKNDSRIAAFIIETKARNTQENIKFSLPKFHCWGEISFCSTWYHLPRILILYWLLCRPYMKKTKIHVLPVWTLSWIAAVWIPLELPKLMFDLLGIYVSKFKLIHQKFTATHQKFIAFLVNNFIKS